MHKEGIQHNCTKSTDKEERHEDLLRQLDLLNTITKPLGRKSGQRELLQEILTNIEREFNLKRCTVTLLSSNGGKLVFKATGNQITSITESVFHQKRKCVTEDVLTTGKATVIPLAVSEADFSGGSHKRGLVVNEEIGYVCVPISIGSQIVGTLAADVPFNTTKPIENIKSLLCIVSCMIAHDVQLRQEARLRHELLEKENFRLREEIAKSEPSTNLKGNSRAIHEVHQRIHRVEGSDMTGLSRNESGTIKEATAPVIPDASTSTKGQSAKVNFVIRSIVETFSQSCAKHKGINLFSGMLSPADIRYLKEIMADFGLSVTIIPDYSDYFDGTTWWKNEMNIEHGISISNIKKTAGAKASIEFRSTAGSKDSAGWYLLERFRTPYYGIPIPVGVKNTDRFFDVVSQLSGIVPPTKYNDERTQLIDSYVDGQKYVFEKRAVVYSEEDLVVAIAGFLAEIGIIPVLCASGGHSGRLREALAEQVMEMMPGIKVLEDTDFRDITAAAKEANPDIILGNSNGYKLKRELRIPLVRVSLPIYDRIGSSRIMHVGYRGAQQLYDRIVNALIEQQQEESPVGSTYI